MGYVTCREALFKTRVMRILSRILDFEAADEEIYFIKLEALCILICLSLCDSEEANVLLHSDLSQEEPWTERSVKLARKDCKRNKSEILEKVENQLTEFLNGQNGPDLKVLSCVMLFYTNMALTGPEQTQKVFEETNLLLILQYLLQNSEIVGKSPEIICSAV